MKTKKKRIVEKTVVMFCGPRHGDPRVDGQSCPTPMLCEGDVCFTRPMRAVRAAARMKARLIFAGDGHGGMDVRRYMEWAKQQGVEQVYGVIYRDNGLCQGSTLSDARGTARLLFEEPTLQQVGKLYLVTDTWHMPRAHLMLRRELDVLCDAKAMIVMEDVTSRIHRRKFTIKKLLVVEGIRSTVSIEAMELQGSLAYLQKTYQAKHPTEYGFVTTYLGPDSIKSVTDPITGEPTVEKLADVIPLSTTVKAT